MPKWTIIEIFGSLKSWVWVELGQIDWETKRGKDNH